MKKVFILLLIAALLVVATGCTDSAPESPASPAPPPATTKAPVVTPRPTTVVTTLPTPVVVYGDTVLVKRDGFSPVNLTVKKGIRVTWLNADSTDDAALYNPTHRIKVKDVFTSQVIPPGVSASWIFTETGIFRYSDMIHPDLQGYVIVE
jgi:plastocyanin